MSFSSVTGQAIRCSFLVVCTGLVTRTSGRGDTSDCCGESNVFLQRALLGLRPQEQFVVPRRGTEVSYRTWRTLQTLFVGRIGRPSIARTFCGGGASQ